MAALSLNDIVSVLASRSGQKFSGPLLDELKAIVNYKRANYTQQFLEKHPDQRRFFQQSFTIDLEKIPPGDCEIPKVTCDLLRSTCKIPVPVRSSYTLFDFVGTSDWTVSYGETRPEFNNFNSFNKYTSRKPKWAFINDRIYLFNDLAIKKLGVRGVFPEPASVNSCCTGTNPKCYSDDERYPIAEDILNSIIRDILNVEFRRIFPQPGVVSVAETKDQEQNTPTVS